MIKKLIICFKDKKLLSDFQKAIGNSKKISLWSLETEDYYVDKQFDVINLPTSFMEEFGSIPLDLDCQIIATKNLHNLPDYVVTSPNFIKSRNLTLLQMGFAQIEIPLLKVREYFDKKRIIYAIHEDFCLAYFEKNNLPIKEILSRIQKILDLAA